MEMGMPGLVDAARHGDREAFEALVRAGSGRLRDRLPHPSRRRPRERRPPGSARGNWDDLPTLRDADRYDPWTYRITCRACYRVAKRERRTSLTTLVDQIARESSAFEAEVADHDELERGFRRLSPEHRAVLVLHYYLGLTIGEVAEVYGSHRAPWAPVCTTPCAACGRRWSRKHEAPKSWSRSR